jgi:hypothetical protein
LQVWTAANPQGFDYRQYGSSKRELVDCEGLTLAITVRKSRGKDDA